MTYNLGFIDDASIKEHVLNTVKKYRFSINLQNFNRNLIDPIKLTFDFKIYKKTLSDIVESESIRQIDKSNTNHIGYFHQNIFQYLGSGWHVPDKGYDVVNLEKKIYVEIKNKHNTMNSSSSQRTYIKMQNTLLQEPNAICMLVEVIAKNSQDIIWKHSIDGMSMSCERIRRVSIDKFYELVTGEKYAFKKLCEAIPKIIDDVLNDPKNTLISNSVFKELENFSPNLIKSLYLLAFAKYQGFEQLEVTE